MANVLANSGLFTHAADMNNISIHLANNLWFPEGSGNVPERHLKNVGPKLNLFLVILWSTVTPYS